MPEVRKERSGWRDEALSLRHRKWGYDVPAQDLDFLLIEYDNKAPVALIEYKNERALPQHLSDVGYVVLGKLGDKAGLPAFAVRYADDFSWWLVVAINGRAKRSCPERRRFAEPEYVDFLYRLRGRKLPSPF